MVQILIKKITYILQHLKKWAGVCKALLKKANVNGRNGKDETPLHKAAVTGDTKTILVFLEAKADVKAKDGMGNFPHNLLPFEKLENVEDYDEVLKKFAESGANLNDESDLERSAVGLLSKASHKKGSLKHVQHLVERHKFDVSGGPHVKKAPLINATTNGDAQLIDYLLQNKADSNTIVKGIGYMEGVSAVNSLVASRSFESKQVKRKVLKSLLDAGANVSQKDKELAKQQDDPKLIDVLEEKEVTDD